MLPRALAALVLIASFVGLMRKANAQAPAAAEKPKVELSAERYENKEQGFSINPPMGLKKIAWPDPKVTVMFRDEATRANLHVRMLPLPPGTKAGPQFAELIDSFKGNPSKAGQGELKVGDKTVPWVAVNQENEGQKLLSVIYMLDGGDKAFLIFSTSKTADDAAMRPQFDASIASFTVP